jgi:uroporphyrin-3 C-methyltransferase
MNQTADTSTNADTDAESTAVTESSVDSGRDEAEADAPQKTARSSSGRWTSGLALLVALLAAAGTGYQWNEQRASGLGGQVAELNADLKAANMALKRLTGESQKIDSELTVLSAQVNGQLANLPARMDQAERTLESIPGASSDAWSTWLLAEVEYLLRVANAQLNLVGNIDVSLQALDLADEKLRDIGSPGLTGVRSLLSEERAALRALPRPDAEGIVLSLSGLANSIDNLPLANHAPGSYGGSGKPDTEESGLQRAWRVIVDALMSIISVKRDEESVTPLMTEAGESILIRSLDMDLQIAKLAILRNESELYRNSLQAVIDRLEKYFDADAPPVQAAKDTVNELLAVELPDAMPDISGSLTLLSRVRQNGMP